MKEKDVVRVCTCGKKLRLSDLQFIGFMSRLALFNCRFCRSTIVVKDVISQIPQRRCQND